MKCSGNAYPLVFSLEGGLAGMSVLLVIFFFITAIVLGPLVIIFGYLYIRRRNINKRELQALRDDIAQIKAEIGEIREQIADFIIRTH